jgi:hypothetical protein
MLRVSGLCSQRRRKNKQCFCSYLDWPRSDPGGPKTTKTPTQTFFVLIFRLDNPGRPVEIQSGSEICLDVDFHTFHFFCVTLCVTFFFSGFVSFNGFLGALKITS